MFRDFSRVERIFAVFGFCLLVVSLYGFWHETDRISHWLGLNVNEEGREIAKVEWIKKVARRRLAGAADFHNLNTSQRIFNRDTIMTGPESSLLILFQDGSLMELGSDAMVEVHLANSQKNDSHVTLTVEKGEVRGSGSGLQLVKEGKSDALMPLSNEAQQALSSAVEGMPAQVKVMQAPSMPQVTTSSTVSAPTVTPTLVPSPTVVSSPSSGPRITLISPAARTKVPRPLKEGGYNVSFTFEVEPKGATGLFELRRDGKKMFLNIFPKCPNGTCELSLKVEKPGVYTWLVHVNELESEEREVTIKDEGSKD